MKSSTKLLSAIMCIIFCISLLCCQGISVFALEYGTTGDIQWSLSDDGVLTLYGDGAGADYDDISEAPWYSKISDIRSLIVSEGVTRIGAYSFEDCTNLTSIDLPDSLYVIADYAFFGCTSLTEVTIPVGVHEVGYGAFGESGLTKVTVLSRSVRYTEDYETYENAITFPESAVFYCGYSQYTDIYCERNNRQIVHVDDYLLIDADKGNSTYDYAYNKYLTANLWKAIKENNTPSDEITFDYTFTLDANEAKNEHNFMAESDRQKIGADINNGGEITLEVSVNFETTDYSVDGLRTYVSYGFTATDPLGETNDNYNHWKKSSGENPFITISSNGTEITVKLQGSAKELYNYLAEDTANYTAVNAMSISVVARGQTYKKSSYGSYLNSDYSSQIEYRYSAWYDVHRKETEVTNLGPRGLNTVSTVKLWDLEEDAPSEYMEPSKGEYYWYATFSRISREYVEELDRCPGDAGFLEVYNGITYGSIEAEYDAGTDPTIRLGDFITDENKAFITSLVGVKPSGVGGEVMIFPMTCQVTYTYADGESVVVDIDASDECTFITKSCMHTCKVCGLCTITDRTTACNTVDWLELYCRCEEPEPSVVVSTPATEEEVSFENNTWAYEPTLEVTFVDVEDSLETAYVEEIGKEIEIDDTVMLFDITLFSDGMPYTMNQWGGDEENIAITIDVGTENAALIESGEAELIHLGDNGAETVPCEANVDDGSITFTTNSLSPFAIIRKNMTDCRHYGRTFLNEKQAEVYDAIDMAIKNAEAKINIDSSLELKSDDIKLIMEMVTADHPDYFWYKGAFSHTRLQSGVVVSVTPRYDINGETVTKEDIAPYREKFNAGVKAVMDEMKVALPNGTDYDKALWLHDKVANIITYKQGKNHQTAYGALIDEEAVCAGYAKLYQDLLIEANIPCWAIKGSSVNPTTGTMETHEWNILWLDGNCVYADVTWDDQGIELFHVYFARDITAMEQEHIPDPNLYADKVPECTPGKCDAYNYFDKVKPEYEFEGTLTEDFLVEILQTKAENKTYVMTVYDADAVDFDEWIKNADFNSIVNKAFNEGKIPAGNYSISINTMGHGDIGEESHIILYVFGNETGLTVSQTNNTVTIDMTVSKNDYNNNNLKISLVFYDENNTAIKFKIEAVNPNETYTVNMPEGAKTFKAILLNSDTLRPMCTAGKIALE